MKKVYSKIISKIENLLISTRDDVQGSRRWEKKDALCIDFIKRNKDDLYNGQEENMREIIRSDVNEEWAHFGIVEAGDFVFISYCVGNIGQPIYRWN